MQGEEGRDESKTMRIYGCYEWEITHMLLFKDVHFLLHKQTFTGQVLEGTEELLET